MSGAFGTAHRRSEIPACASSITRSWHCSSVPKMPTSRTGPSSRKLGSASARALASAVAAPDRYGGLHRDADGSHVPLVPLACLMEQADSLRHTAGVRRREDHVVGDARGNVERHRCAADDREGRRSRQVTDDRGVALRPTPRCILVGEVQPEREMLGEVRPRGEESSSRQVRRRACETSPRKRRAGGRPGSRSHPTERAARRGAELWTTRSRPPCGAHRPRIRIRLPPTVRRSPRRRTSARPRIGPTNRCACPG